MANRDDLSFMFALISLLTSAGDALQHQLGRLPAEILAWIIVFAFSWYVIIHVFRYLFKNKPPIQIGTLKLSCTIIFAVPTMTIIAILLLL